MIFQYEFMRIAFVVGTAVAVIVPCMGSIMIFRRMSMIGEALSHVSLSGVVLGLLLGFNPVLGAIAMSVFAGLSIEMIRKKLKGYNEVSLTVITSLGIGITGILLGFIKTSANLDSFLFGSILTISRYETRLILLFSLIVCVLFLFFYRQFFMIAFDEEAAFLSGINVNRMNTLFIILTAITVSVASRIVGALIVSSLMVIPVITAMQIAPSYLKTLLYSVVFSMLSIWFGLILAFYIPFGLKPSGTIVIVSVVILLVVIVYKTLNRKIKH